MYKYPHPCGPPSCIWNSFLHEQMIRMSRIIWISILVSTNRVLHPNMFFVCLCYLFLTLPILCFFILWNSLVSAAINWVSVNSTSFYVLDEFLITSTRFVLTFSLLWSSSASIIFFFTVLNAPKVWSVVFTWRKFTWC